MWAGTVRESPDTPQKLNRAFPSVWCAPQPSSAPHQLGWHVTPGLHLVRSPPAASGGLAALRQLPEGGGGATACGALDPTATAGGGIAQSHHQRRNRHPQRTWTGSSRKPRQLCRWRSLVPANALHKPPQSQHLGCCLEVGLDSPGCELHPVIDAAATPAGPECAWSGTNSGSGGRHRRA